MTGREHQPACGASGNENIEAGKITPLSPAGRWRYHFLIGAIIFFGVAAIVLAR